jgi:predicted nucleic-acid-binding protein
VSAGLDTSVLVRLLIGEPAEQATVAWNFLNECMSGGEPARVSDLVVAEAFFVLQHHYAVPLKTTLQQLTALLTDPRIVADASALKVMRLPNLATAKPGFVDRLIHGNYQVRGDSLTTFDKTAGRLPDARLLRR